MKGDGSTCSLCGKVCRGVIYKCNICYFRLHKSCLDNLPHSLQSFFHPCPLVLHRTSLPYRCEACRERRSGMSFSCRKCGFDMEPICALASIKMSETGIDGKLQHFSHGHPLKLIQEDANNCCKACGKICFGPTYKCAGNSFYSYTCKFFLHKSCADLLPEIQHPFHPKHTLSLQAKLPESVPASSGCSACGQESSGFIYFCAKCTFYMDVNCASLTPSIKYNQHKHLLTLFDEAESCFDCNLCGKTCRGSFLRCVECKFNLHVHCHPSLPLTINHECHVDPLTFTKLLVQDDFYEANEFYCDVCEEKRNPEASVYYCAECDYVAHVRCVISEVFSEEARIDANSFRSDTRITELDNEITKLYREMKVLKEEATRVKARMEAITADLKGL
ncbi:uncharacterized protein LOC110811452 [Carica papaya]|uniref:uncharacterized protein LOC110811452 n=1 Tax=Carica papaya TaxID=3649 RepID=UPI000B8CDD49|nr:uncharacterized protein LOC110811452 [Carica papaya]